MAFRIVHKNSAGCVINEDSDDIGCETVTDETEINNTLIRYINATDMYVGDTLTIVTVS